ncbi:MAG: QueT transporter family protein [Clostridiales bacterium]|nr:QueT transporter family protein [Clostridiales bacterium]
MNTSLRKLTAAAAVGALYAVLTMVLAPISYAPLPVFPIEFRISEVLCILPFFFPASTVGIFIGCLIANILSPFGIIDVIFGSLASLLAGLCTVAIGKKARRTGETGLGSCATACFMPVLFNAPIIGAVIAYSSTEYAFWKGFAIYAAQVGIGEAGVMFVLALPLMRIVLKNKALTEFFDKLN